MCLLTVNILLGLLLSTKFNPVLQWPRRKINVLQIHTWTGYIAMGLVCLHPILLLSSGTAGFKIADVLWPVNSPGQRLYNWFGAIAFYFVTVVVVTSYFRPQLRSKVWKAFHYSAYVAATFLFIHGILIDPELKKRPPDFLDGEKVLVESCCAAVVAASVWRLRYGLRGSRRLSQATASLR